MMWTEVFTIWGLNYPDALVLYKCENSYRLELHGSEQIEYARFYLDDERFFGYYFDLAWNSLMGDRT